MTASRVVKDHARLLRRVVLPALASVAILAVLWEMSTAALESLGRHRQPIGSKEECAWAFEAKRPIIHEVNPPMDFFVNASDELFHGMHSLADREAFYNLSSKRRSCGMHGIPIQGLISLVTCQGIVLVTLFHSSLPRIKNENLADCRVAFSSYRFILDRQGLNDRLDAAPFAWNFVNIEPLPSGIDSLETFSAVMKTLSPRLFPRASVIVFVDSNVEVDLVPLLAYCGLKSEVLFFAPRAHHPARIQDFFDDALKGNNTAALNTRIDIQREIYDREKLFKYSWLLLPETMVLVFNPQDARVVNIMCGWFNEIMYFQSGKTGVLASFLVPFIRLDLVHVLHTLPSFSSD